MAGKIAKTVIKRQEMMSSEYRKVTSDKLRVTSNYTRIERHVACDCCRVTCHSGERDYAKIVIPAKLCETGREPGSRSSRYHTVSWIPDLALLRVARPE